MQLCIIAGSGNLPLQLAKENKEFNKADQIRDKLLKFQIVLEDQPKKTIWRKS